MVEPSKDMSGASQQADFERLTALVSEEFQVENAQLEFNVPTYYLKHPQETKEPFLRLLKKLEPWKMIALVRRVRGKTVLRVVQKPVVKPSNVLINWALLLATIATTFYSGYVLSIGLIDPLIGGAAFTSALLLVLGSHEMGHKLTANKNKMDATLPYFIPGIPPFGTFGAVIMQKSLPPNKDALFDIGANGPVTGFVLSVIISAVGLSLSVPKLATEVPNGTPIGVPFLWMLLEPLLEMFGLMPHAPINGVLLLHPIAFAGWVGLIVTMLNLLPAAMLDGGHIARSTMGDLVRYVFTGLSIALLLVMGLIPMAILVMLMAFYRHPGPLDDVSSLSTSRKLLSLVLVAIFILCLVPSLTLL